VRSWTAECNVQAHDFAGARAQQFRGLTVRFVEGHGPGYDAEGGGNASLGQTFVAWPQCAHQRHDRHASLPGNAGHTGRGFPV